MWERKVAMPACWLRRGVYKGAGPALEPPREAYGNACGQAGGFIMMLMLLVMVAMVVVGAVVMIVVVVVVMVVMMVLMMVLMISTIMLRCSPCVKMFRERDWR